VELVSTSIGFPEPRELPPQDELYHCQDAPTPRDPPLTVNVVRDFSQVGLGDAVTEDGAVDGLPTETPEQTATELVHGLVAVTQTCAEPEKAGCQLTVPVFPVPAIEFPLPETVQMKDVAPAAVVL
jgi:hypothetical protein